jgi:hypothetical protein
MRSLRCGIPHYSGRSRLARALSLKPSYHSILIDALCSIPLVQPGDTVFWHSDVIHAVEDEHKGAGSSNVLYLSSAPGCTKNTNYLELQTCAFLTGKTPPDFAPDDFEADFAGRATEVDLTDLGRKVFGIADAGIDSSGKREWKELSA